MAEGGWRRLNARERPFTSAGFAAATPCGTAGTKLAFAGRRKFSSERRFREIVKRTRMFAACVSAGLALTATLGQALDRGPSLKDDEAIVLIHTHCRMISDLEFWQIGKKERFTLRACTNLHPLIVKAGHYYLHSITPVYANVATAKQKEPSSAEATLDVQAGAVTYLGDVGIQEDKSRPDEVGWKTQVDFRPETLLKAKRDFPWLEKLPLFAVQVGRPPIPVSWSTDDGAARAK